MMYIMVNEFKMDNNDFLVFLNYKCNFLVIYCVLFSNFNFKYF